MVGVAVQNLCRWLFTEQGDILHQLPGGEKAFQSTFFHTVCLQILQFSELFQNFFDLEQLSFMGKFDNIWEGLQFLALQYNLLHFIL